MSIFSIVGDYTVYSSGRVFNKFGKELKQDKGRYCQVTLFIDGKRCRYYTHRLVASLFIPNPNNKKTVNHINGDKQDNRVENLEWTSLSENQLHSIHVLGNYPVRRGNGVHYRKSHKKPWIAQISINGKKMHIGSFNTELEALNAYTKVKEDL